MTRASKIDANYPERTSASKNYSTYLMHDRCRKHYPNARRVVLEIQVPGKLTDKRRHHPGSKSLAGRTPTPSFVSDNQPEPGLVLRERYLDRSSFS
jgi:hypothetical protein